MKLVYNSSDVKTQKQSADPKPGTLIEKTQLIIDWEKSQFLH